VGWIFGSGWPYPQSLQIASGWWLAVGLLLWAGVQVLLWRRRHPLRALLVGIAGPAAALLVTFSWSASLLFHAYGSRMEGSDRSSVLQWLLDGHLVRLWRAASGWILSLIGVTGSIQPAHLIEGSSGVALRSVIVLGILNEAMLGCLCATAAVLLAGRIREIRRRP
jgi:hypothetical protein